MSGLAFEDYKEEGAHGSKSKFANLGKVRFIKERGLLLVVYQIFPCPATPTTCNYWCLPDKLYF